MKNMRLYHGSNVSIKTVELSKSKHGKDFGRGFYFNPNEAQAKEMAEAKADFLGGTPMVSVFEFNPKSIEQEELKIKVF